MGSRRICGLSANRAERVLCAFFRLYAIQILYTAFAGGKGDSMFEVLVFGAIVRQSHDGQIWYLTKDAVSINSPGSLALMPAG